MIKLSEICARARITCFYIIYVYSKKKLQEITEYNDI